MAESIDELKIEVETDASAASNTIDSLTSELGNLQNSIKGLNLSKLGKLPDTLKEISSIKFDDSLEGLSGLSQLIESMSDLPSVSKFTRLARGLTELNKADVSNMKDIAFWMDKLSDTLANFSSNRSYNVNLNLGEATSSESIENTEQLTNAMDEQTSASSNLSGSVSDLNTTFKSFSDTEEETTQSAEQAAEGLNEMSDAEENVDSSDVKKLGEEVDKTAEKTTQSTTKVVNFADIVTNAFTKTWNEVKRLLSAMGKSGLGGLESIFKGAGNAATTLGKKALTVATNIGKITAQNTPLAKLPNMFKSVSNAVDTLSSKMSRMVRLFTMMVTRTAFRTVFDKLSESFEHLAKYSDRVNKQYSELLSLMNQLAHSITAVVQPLLNIFAPALQYIIQLLNTATNYMNQFLSAITGKTYTTGKYVATDYADSLEDAADAADDATAAQKKLNKQLQGFNELNNLTTTEPSTSTSSTGDVEEEMEDCYETLDIAQDILDFVEKIKQAWADADFTEVGAILGEKLKEALESIPWDEIEEQAAKIAHSLATLINGFIETEGLGETIGNTLGEAINTALIFADDFLQTIHWDSLGQFVADIVNGAIESVNWELLGQTLGDALVAWLEYGFNLMTNIHWDELGDDLATSVNKFIDVIDEALVSYNWSEVGEDLATGLNHLINGIEWDDLGKTLGDAFNALLGVISGAIEKFDFASAGEDLAVAMNLAFATINWGEIGTTIQNGINGAFEYIYTWASTFDWESFGNDIATAINNALKGINWETAISAAKEIGSGIAKALANVMTTETFENVGETIAGAMNTVIAGVGAFLDDTDFEQLGKDVAAGINKWLGKMDFEELGRTLGKVIQGAFDFLSGLIGEDGIDWSAVKKALQELWNGICEEVDFNEAGPIIVAALGAWLGGNLVSGIISTVGEAIGLSFALELAGAMAGGVTATGLGTVVTALGGVLALALGAAGIAYIISQVDWEGVGQAIQDKFQETVSQLTAAVKFIIDPDNSELVIPDDFGDKEVQEYFDNLDVKIKVEALVEDLVDNLDDSQKSVEVMGEIIKVLKANGLDTSNVTIDELVGYVSDLVAQNPDMTIEDIAASISKFIYDKNEQLALQGEIESLSLSDAAKGTIVELSGMVQDLVVNVNDSEKTTDMIGRIATLLFGEDVTNTEITGLTALVEKLKSNGDLTLENTTVIAEALEAYATIIGMEDDIPDSEKVIEATGNLVKMISDDNITIDDVTARVTEILNNGGTIEDCIAEIVSLVNESNDRIALSGYLQELIDGIPDKDRYIEVLGEIYKLITGDSASDTVIDDLTGIVTKLEQKGQLTIENVTAAVQAYAELVGIQDNLSDSDKVVEAAAKIVELITGNTASSTQLDGVTAIITDILGNGGTIDDCIAEIVSYLNDSNDTLDATANIVKMDWDKTQSALEVEGEMTINALNIPSSLKNVDGITATVTELAKQGNLNLSDVSATIGQLYKEGSLSISDITAIIDKLTQNGTLSLSDVNAIVKDLITSGNLSLDDVNAIISTLTKNGTLSLSDISASVNSLSKSGSPSLASIAATVSDVSPTGSPTLAKIAATINDVSPTGSPTLAKIAATINDVSATGSPTLAKIAATINEVSPTGSPTLEKITASVSSLTSSTTQTLSGVKATMASGGLSSSYTQTLDGIKAAMMSGGLSSSSTQILSGIKATMVSGGLSSSSTQTLSGIKATMVSGGLSSSSTQTLSGIKATMISGGLSSTTTQTLSGIKAKVASGGLSMSSSTETALKNLKATVSSASPSDTKNPLLKKIKATVSSATPTKNAKLREISATVKKLTNSGASLTLSGTARSRGSSWSVRMARRGGILRNGSWLSIPQYADGELNAGSLFVAGENGPEVVAHIGGQTEVLNQSQLAAVMRDSILAGISSLSVYLNSLYSHMTVCANGIIGAIAVSYNTPDFAPDITTYTNFDMNSRMEDHEADIDEMISILSQIESNTEGSEEIASDPNGLFKIMRKKNNEYRLATGKSAF